LDFRNPWGKVLKEMVSDLKIFAHKGCKIAVAKKVFYGFKKKNFVPFKHLFAPTSRSLMSKPFGFSESLGKSIGKKWSQI
jgi:hypothetical protein